MTSNNNEQEEPIPRIDIDAAHLGLGRFDGHVPRTIHVYAHDPKVETVYHFWLTPGQAAVLCQELSRILAKQNVKDEERWIG